MSVTFNTQTMKYREDETDPWSPLTVHIDASVDAVVQDEEPTGSENVWFDTSDTTEVSVPTMTDFNTLQNTIDNLHAFYHVTNLSSTARNINIPTSSRHLFAFAGSSAQRSALLLVSANSSGTVEVLEVVKGSDVTYSVPTGTTNTLTVNSNGSCAAFAITFNGQPVTLQT